MTDLFSILLSSLIVATLLVAGLSILISVLRFRAEGELQFPGLGRILVGAFVVFLVIFGLQSIAGAMATVPAGSVGVKLRNGAAQEGTLAPGFHWITPYVNQVAALSTREFTLRN